MQASPALKSVRKGELSCNDENLGVGQPFTGIYEGRGVDLRDKFLFFYFIFLSFSLVSRGRNQGNDLNWAARKDRIIAMEERKKVGSIYDYYFPLNGH